MKPRAEQHAVVPLIIADIFELAGAFRRAGEAIARNVGQTQARWQVLSAASGTPMTVPQIARRLGVSRQNVQRIADLLVTEKLAAPSDNPDHRSSKHLVLTERGRDCLAQLNAAAATLHQAMADQARTLDLDRVRGELRALAALARTFDQFDQGDGKWTLRSSVPARTAPRARSREP